MIVECIEVAGFEEETTVIDANFDQWRVPLGGMHVMHLGPPLVLPNGTKLDSGGGVQTLVFRQHQPPAAEDPDWIGHRFEAVMGGNTFPGLRYMRTPPPLRSPNNTVIIPGDITPEMIRVATPTEEISDESS